MPLFRVQGNDLERLSAKTVDFERDLQVIFEKNLPKVLNVTFLAHEYTTTAGGRIDTLGIDADGSPVIIEYKRTKTDNVINQGLSYLRWLKDHQDSFRRLCQERGITVEVDWDSPRVICVAESFNRFDLDTVAVVLPLRVELYRYLLVDNTLLQVEREQSGLQTQQDGVNQPRRRTHEATLQRSFTLEDHLKHASSETKQIFSKLREFIRSLDEEVIEEPKKHYIAYKLTSNFVDITILQRALKVFLNVKSGQLSDPHHVARDLSNPHIGHWGNGDYEIRVDGSTDLTKVFDLIEQSFHQNK